MLTIYEYYTVLLKYSMTTTTIMWQNKDGADYSIEYFNLTSEKRYKHNERYGDTSTRPSSNTGIL